MWQREGNRAVCVRESDNASVEYKLQTVIYKHV